jgi:glutathione S-transferase
MNMIDRLPALVTLLALFVYVWNFVACGRAREKFGVKAPAVSGHPQFEARFRVQQNMLEQLIIFLPALWLFSITLSPLYGAVIGLVFVVGRILYSLGYYADPSKRGTGFMISAIATLVLLLGATVGTVQMLLL